MPPKLDRQLLLNRSARERLRLAGLDSLAQHPCDLEASRRIGLWRGSPGSDIYLLGLIGTAVRHMVGGYFQRAEVRFGHNTLELAGRSRPLQRLGGVLAAFLDCYPHQELVEGVTPERSQAKDTARGRLVGELFLLDVLLDNPAAGPYLDLFDDRELRARLDYRRLLVRLSALIRPEAGGGVWSQSLPDLLRAPLRAAPGSLAGQANFILAHWGAWLPAELLTEMQVARAIAEEESRPRFSGPGPSESPFSSRDTDRDAPAAFSADVDWMSSAVLLAKSIFVWLDQLSRDYRRPVVTLHDIPEEELERLARRGFNALWLIGLWERSRASKQIKQLCGNPEAEASAYALHAYRVAAELGGEDALNAFHARCRNHGIRLACDIVPNHTGIDSEWVREHPDWFLQADHPPYPGYRFSGPDLCDSADLSIRIEDGYWDHSDAAVVCELVDHRSGRHRYLYHGNDGTHMPWNDTAQLNFLLPEVRRAMSDLIVHIAQRFSLIRFDAAMTLARKHFRRLWFPPPGGSAGVPSRSSFWMSDADFDRAFPHEFWREVVDRVNREAPDTLLLAEAFWLMESYFVRTLGMHRVYNSAFMNMLKREENAKYRTILKDILAFNPEILKRYVNFMNNPDEATAVEQFGKGDKYFGVATLLATLPGLPMFGHGQIEGYREKYGMEYRRAYFGEEPDTGFVAHHDQQVFPLLRRRWLFAGVEHFSLFDFATEHGVNENVFAFCNGPPGQRHLVVYNNSPHGATGRLHHASPKAGTGQEGLPQPMPHLWQQIGLESARGGYCRFRDLRGMEHLRSSEALLAGLELHLSGYGHQVFSAFQQIDDPDGAWRLLEERLQGQPVVDLDREMLRLRYLPLWQAFTALLSPERLQVLAGGLTAAPLTRPHRTLIAEMATEVRTLVNSIAAELGIPERELPAALSPVEQRLPQWLKNCATLGMPHRLLAELWSGSAKEPGLGAVVLAWWLVRMIGDALGPSVETSPPALLRRFGLDHAWRESTATPRQERDVRLAMLLLETEPLTPHPAIDEPAFVALVEKGDLRNLLGINRHAGTTWFSREGLSGLAGALALQADILQLAERDTQPTGPQPGDSATLLRRRLARAAAVGYRLDKFLRLE